MNAVNARKIYFENYVEFECLIRKIHKNAFQAGKFEPSTTTNELKEKRLAFADLITKIASSRFFSILQIKASVLNVHKNNRNWLAHTCKQQVAKKEQIKSFKNIKAININLEKALKKIKERHPRSGRASIQ